MSEKVFMKGCEAVAEAAVRAGCRFYAGYPITPQNDVPEYLSRRLPKVGGIFLQGSSEVEASNMLYGGAASGTRSMTTSSSCGISLMSETISWLALQHLPAVIGNFQRGGPGIGSIFPSQQDYTQATKASGNGGFQMIVQAPATVQEAADMTYEAFDLADRYSYPVYILLDGFIGTMMEAVTLPEPKSEEELTALKANKDYVPRGRNADGTRHMVNHSFEPLQSRNARDAAMYEEWKKSEARWESLWTDDAEWIVTGYGIAGRIAKSVVKKLRQEGYKVGFIRPKRVHPFPEKAFTELDSSILRGIVSTELSIPAQYAVDVKIAVKDRIPVETVLCSGGEIITFDEIYETVVRLYGDK